jgi:putative transcriptional regulator
MPSKKPLNSKELAAWENTRDIAAELRESVRQMTQGLAKPVEISPVVVARAKSGLSQANFAKLMGVSVRTLQEWEQGRRNPSGAAKTLLAIAEKHPGILAELSAI